MLGQDRGLLAPTRDSEAVLCFELRASVIFGLRESVTGGSSAGHATPGHF